MSRRYQVDAKENNSKEDQRSREREEAAPRMREWISELPAPKIHEQICSSLPRNTLERVLLDQGLGEECTGAILNEGREVLGSADLQFALTYGLGRLLPFSSGIPEDISAFALVGPQAAQKSAAALQLATYLAHAKGWRVAIVSVESEEDKGEFGLAQCARMLGIPHMRCHFRSGLFIQLAKMLAELGRCDLVIIDTPAFSSSDRSSARVLCEDLNMMNDVERLLVLPAEMERRQQSSLMKQWCLPGFERVILTGCGDSARCGAAVDLVFRMDKSFAYLIGGAGPRGTVEPASAEALAEVLLRQVH